MVRDAYNTYQQLSKECDIFLDDSFIRIRSRLNTMDKRHALVIFNPGLESVRQVVHAECPPWLRLRMVLSTLRTRSASFACTTGLILMTDSRGWPS